MHDNKPSAVAVSHRPSRVARKGCRGPHPAEQPEWAVLAGRCPAAHSERELHARPEAALTGDRALDILRRLRRARRHHYLVALRRAWETTMKAKMKTTVQREG